MQPRCLSVVLRSCNSLPFLAVSSMVQPFPSFALQSRAAWCSRYIFCCFFQRLHLIACSPICITLQCAAHADACNADSPCFPWVCHPVQHRKYLDGIFGWCWCRCFDRQRWYILRRQQFYRPVKRCCRQYCFHHYISAGASACIILCIMCVCSFLFRFCPSVRACTHMLSIPLS
jgi:hypothetical protein